MKPKSTNSVAVGISVHVKIHISVCSGPESI